MKFLKFYYTVFSTILVLSCTDPKMSKSSENDSNNINNKFALGIENDLKFMNLQKHPKSIKEFKYNAIIKDREVFPDSNNNKKEDIFYSFNKRGNLIEKIEYAKSIAGSSKHSKYYYDGDGNTIEINNSDSKYIYEYDSLNRKILEVFYSPKNKIYSKQKFVFNTENNLEKREWFLPNGDLKNRQLFYYDSVGNKTKAIMYKKDKISFSEIIEHKTDDSLRIHKHYNADNTLNRKAIYKITDNYEEVTSFNELENKTGHAINYYDTLKRHTGWEGFNLDGTSKGKRTIEYDRLGNKILEKTTPSENHSSIMDKLEEFVYEHDKNNNWIKKVRIYNEEPTTIIIREIEYYQ